MSVSAPTPNVPGFIAADKNLRAQFGVAIIFAVPQVPQWPPGTQINPDTGQPYSAMVVQQNPPFATVTVTALVILKEASPLRPQADTQFAEPGLMSGMDIILDVDAADFPTVQAASEFRYTTRNYKVEEQKPFAFANVTYRWLIYGKER